MSGYRRKRQVGMWKVPSVHVLMALHELGDWVPATEVAAWVYRAFGDGLSHEDDGRSVSHTLGALLDERAVERREQNPRMGPPPLLWRITDNGRVQVREWLAAVADEADEEESG